MGFRRRNAVQRTLSDDAISNALPIPPLPLQQVVTDARHLLTVPWALLLQGMLQTIAEPTYLEGTHADRLDEASDPGEFGLGTYFYETDRQVLYQARLVKLVDPAHPTDPPVPTPCWVYISGTMRDTLANKPTDLGHATWTNHNEDTGFLFYATDYAHTWRWTGTTWEYAPGDRSSGEIAWFTANPGTGWVLCNGSSVTRTTATAGTSAFTTPNLIGAYAKGASTYTGTLVATSNGTISGSTASEAAHTHGIDHDHPPFMSAETVVDNAFNSGPYDGVAQHHKHSIDVPAYTGTSGAGSAHSHGAGTLALSGSDPAHVDLLPYYRI